MDEKAKKEYKIATKNRNKAFTSIPSKLVKKEKNFAKNIRKNKASNFEKLERLFSITDELGKYLLRRAPCKKQCDSCCYYPVAVSRLEAEYIAKKHALRLKTFTPIKPINYHGKKCTFLKDNLCSIYEDRPYPCRRHVVFSSDNKYCEPSISNDYEFPLVRFTELEATQKYVVEDLSDGEWRDIRDWFE